MHRLYRVIITRYYCKECGFPGIVDGAFAENAIYMKFVIPIEERTK